jgi:hypothetical protein
MNTSIFLLLSILCILLSFSCKEVKKENVRQGIVKYRGEFFDTTGTFSSKPVVVDELRVFYKDSLAIEEIIRRSYITDTANKTTIEERISHYIFIDIPKGKYYFYKNLSDTAKSFKSYASLDSFKTHAGWNFINADATQFKGASQSMKDTVINNVKYKRLKKAIYFGKYPYSSIGYFRCDKIGTLFKFDTNLSDSIGCPLVKIEDSPINKGAAIRSEIIFLTDTLSKQEVKIFDAWSKNEK